MTTSEETLDACMSMIEAAARAGERCPTGEQIAARMRSLGMSDSVDGAVPQLARAGKLRIEVGHRNWRVVKILAGPAKGLNTAYPPNGLPWRPYLIIGPKGREIPKRRQRRLRLALS